MFCLGPNPPLVLVVLSALFEWLLPAGVLLGALALAVAISLPRCSGAAIALGRLSLVLLVEPMVYLTIKWVAPILLGIGTHTEFVAWLIYAALPFNLPLLAMWLAHKSPRACGITRGQAAGSCGTAPLQEQRRQCRPLRVHWRL